MVKTGSMKIHEATYQELDAFRIKGETFDGVIKRLLALALGMAVLTKFVDGSIVPRDRTEKKEVTGK